MDNRAIGVFDSGLGGLTATQELKNLLPDEHIIYLGDSYNMPYGEKNKTQIIEMSLNDLAFLLARDVKAVFVACGTATSNALEALMQSSPVPVFGVVEPAVLEAINSTNSGKIGLLATRASIQSGTYQRLLNEISPNVIVTAQACPKFATMVEYGIFDKADERVLKAVSEYLPPLKQAGVDTVILGCTHYPLLADVISDYMGKDVKLISAGAAAARKLSENLRENNLTCNGCDSKTEYYTTGSTASFARTAELMLKHDISPFLLGIAPFDKGSNI
ncbi:MAG: glutamate racemase [Oscillospiraceae bacterium]|nr:glutamate racemase [Oscillospiraceae bacterium]